MAEVVFDGVTKVFGDGTVAVDSLNLRIEDGSLMVLVGPSGCGKTTSLRMVAGLEETTTGEIRIGDHMVNDVAPKDRDIAMVFQNYALYPHMTVFENMAFGLRLRKMKRPGSASTRRRTPSSSSTSSPASRASSRAASGSASRWAGRSSASRRPS
jgi:multiple sugar transport system ATP-binding protein